VIAAPPRPAAPGRGGAGRRMRTVRRLFYADIVSAVAFVVLAFLGLFFFIDFVDELGSVGQRGYTVLHAVGYSLLLAPGHLYELLPLAVLIGAIYALARLAQSSQYTILRTGGLGPGRALALLAGLALAFGAITFVVGDYLAPISENFASQLRAVVRGSLKLERSGAWIKEHAETPAGERSYSINVGSASANSVLRQVRIFEFDAGGKLLSRTSAAEVKVHKDGRWTLSDVELTRWRDAGIDSTARQERLASLEWKSTLSPKVVAAAVLPVTTMSTLELWRYIDHLAENEQTAQLQKIQFWKRALYPFACLVMIALALPFAYLSARSGGVSLKVFVGIMLGVSFVLINNVFRHLGLLGNWTPWIVAAAPGLLYLMVSLGAFAWLVRNR
jgi:lipopolysaccharide export system permease protein